MFFEHYNEIPEDGYFDEFIDEIKDLKFDAIEEQIRSYHMKKIVKSMTKNIDKAILDNMGWFKNAKK